MSISYRQNTVPNRNPILFATAMISLCLGASYSFGIFIKPLAELHGWSISQVMLAFTLNGALSPLPMILGGKVVDAGHSRKAIILGGLLFSFCFCITGHISQLWLLYVVYSFLGSLGLRISYAGLIGNSMKLFWDKKGLATGVIAAAYAAATILIAPIANFLIETQGVVVAFQYLGLSYMLIILAAGFFIQNAPAPNTPLQLSKATTPHLKKPGVELNWRQMLRTKRFYLIVLIFICGSMAGLMLVASASILGQNFFALSAATAAVYVSVYSLCNCLGRFIFGPLSDKLGRYPTLLMICILLTVVLLQAALFQNRFSFLVVLIGVGLGFGGTMSIIPTLVSENFGLLHCGINYGITYIGYSLGSVCGPLIAAAFTDTGDNIALLFYLSMAFAIAGALFTRLLQKQAIKKRIQL